MAATEDLPGDGESLVTRNRSVLRFVDSPSGSFSAFGRLGTRAGTWTVTGIAARDARHGRVVAAG
jgi:hypothetical protein